MTNVTSRTVRLGSGHVIPQVGLGVWQMGGAETRAAVRAALELGYRHIDTARIYGNEADVGRGIRDAGLAREQVFVTTKLWNAEQGYDRALKAFDASLERLGFDYVDLYLLHWPVAGLRLESWRALERLHREGRARSIGVSNFLVGHLEELVGAAELTPHVNQLELTPFLQRADTVAFCRKHGIVLEAYSPLTRGERLNDPVVNGIARELSRSPAQVLLRWGIQQGFVVLPKSKTPERIRENSELFDFELDRAQLAKLDALEEGLTTGWDPAEQA
ncbi:MAG TPA: aldo/keto reductase [Polyangiaceae bacterium]|nr:aldo/keto reductase [Polyangiaceae bacterium]